MSKQKLQKQAIRLRTQGYSYSEILKIVPVARSTLSLWLRKIGLSMRQQQQITEKRIQGQQRGAEAQRNKRIRRQQELIGIAQNQIGTVSKRELWLIGTALYWAEGSKEKEYRPGSLVRFSNSDPQMIALFIKWLKECVYIDDEDVYADLYIHESHTDKIEEVLKEWGRILNKKRSFFRHVYLKRNKIRTKRKNIGILYIGLIRVTIRSSSDLNRKITGWIKGITHHWGIV